MNSKVLNLKFFFIVSSLSGVWVDSVANFGFLSKRMNKRHHVVIVARTTNIGLLYPNVCNNIGGHIPIDVPPNQNIGGDVSPASPAALTPVRNLPPSAHVGSCGQRCRRQRSCPVNLATYPSGCLQHR